MIHALGYSLTAFDPSNPGRLCRGRERWVEGFSTDTSLPHERLVISGAEFTDDTARDARRGVEFSGLRMGEIVSALFPDQLFLAFCEQGHPLAVPESAILREEHLQPRLGGRRMDPCVRWRLPVRTPEEIEQALSGAPVSAEGLVPFDGVLTASLEEALFLLTAQNDRLTPPERRIQPAALGGLLEIVPYVVVVHLDKHGSILAVYGRDLGQTPKILEALAESKGTLSVPFTIPPMLARWDRALLELRLAWERTRAGRFPVPPGDEIPRESVQERTRSVEE